MHVDKEMPVSVWPEWKIIEKIGEGSFGKVYKAQRTEKGHSFYSAIKIITIPASKSELNSVRSETGDEQSTREYFENIVEECIQEVSTMEYFRGNSHVVSVEDFKVMEYQDEIGWDISIRMEFLTSFPEYCAGKKLTQDEVLKLGIDLCKALEYCSQLHIIHRDIKPENIFVSRFGDFKLGDFGIARELEKTMSSLSKKGTYSYMAPEMYRGETYDRRVDIYSLGIVLYKLLNRNRLPFLSLEKQLITYRDKENALARRMSGEELPDPVDAERNLSRIIRKACAFAPEKRYQSPEEFRKELELFREGICIPQAEQKEEREDTIRTERVPKEQWDDLSRTIISGPQPQQPWWKNWKNSAATWAIALVAVVLGACVIVGVYLKTMLEDTVREQTEKMMNALQTQSVVVDEDTGEDFTTSLEIISERATTIVNELDAYTCKGEEGKRLRYYDSQGQIRKVLVYPSVSEDGVYEEYYYWNGALFFAYIWKDNESEMYYYRDGMLIRWIDKAGDCHDNDWEDEEYVERGDKYWLNSIAQLE
jgi:serine/threonine-protein kinase